jgi:hypothetical protein
MNLCPDVVAHGEAQATFLRQLSGMAASQRRRSLGGESQSRRTTIAALPGFAGFC